MKILSNNREGNKVSLEIEVENNKLKESIEKTLVEAGKNIKIPGFRAGKAPREMVERALDREAVEARAAQNLISDLYPSIIEETRIDPVDYPNVEIVQQNKTKPFIFKLSVDVYPEIKLGKYKGLKVEKKQVEVTDEDVIKVLGNINERFAGVGPDGKKEVLPLDDEFAKKVSRFGTLAELKEEVRQSLKKDREASSQAELKNNLVASASAEAEVDIPNGMIEREIELMLDELAASLARSGLSLEDYLKGIKKEKKELREEFRKSAEVRVRGKVVLKAIAEAEKMEISQEEMDKEIEQMASASGQKLEDIKMNLGESQRKYIEEYMLRSKALDFIVDKAKIKEVKS